MDAANSLINQALGLMLAGMGTVFLFLLLLVWTTQLMSKLVTKFSSEVGGGAEVSAEEIAAATAAVAQYRREK